MDESVKQLGALAIVIVVVVAIMAFAKDTFIPDMKKKMTEQMNKITYVMDVNEAI